MPSLFSRSRTQSTPHNKAALAVDVGNVDDFGRIQSGQPVSPASSRKEKNKAGRRDKENDRAKSRNAGAQDFDRSHPISDGSFLPLTLDRPRDESSRDGSKVHDYGHLSYARHTVLGLEQVQRLVEVVTDELNTRGLTTPFVFSSLALNISTSGIKRLIQTFLNSCAKPTSNEAQQSWLEEARFASPHELGMFLRWGLARYVRLVGEEDVRGLLSWEQYDAFCDSEAALNYPPAHFDSFLQQLESHVSNILVKVLTLLTGLTAHGASSGHTPPTLSPLFGPLIFGLGPATLPFQHAYIRYLRAANATEHLILAFIRWQDTPRSAPPTSPASPTSYSSTALGVPTKLKYWIRGYPFAMLPFLEDRHHKTKPQPRKGARTIRVVSVRRNVRMYSPDLVKTCGSWAQRSHAGAKLNDLAMSKVWERICPPALKLPPKYSDSYKKRMDLPANFEPECGPGSIMTTTSDSSMSSKASTLLGEDTLGLGQGLLSGRGGEDRFMSLADMKWGEFETMGFAGLGATDQKLQFDLTEGARTARAEKRTTLNWNDFSTAGFSRTDAPLSATLQFSMPVSHTITSWPTHSAEISKKLKKTQKALPPFGWDTEPVMGQEEVIEEAFLDVFCDLIYGGGWMDLERVEETDRECNWALVDFKSLPYGQSTVTTTPGSDPRTDAAVILFEEFVPLEYRQQLISSTSRPRFRSLFHSKSKQWKPAPTLNGRPYVVGLVPQSPSLRELEFDTMLKSSTGTKVISLASHGSTRRPLSSQTTDTPRFSMVSAIQPASTETKKTGNQETDLSTSPPGRKLSRFRLPVGLPGPGPGVRKAGMAPSEYSTVDFETRLASYSDDEYDGVKKGGRRESKDDAWVDILVGSQDRRMVGQDSEAKKPGLRGLRAGRSDPELASQEVAKALAAVKERAPSTDEGPDGIEPYANPAFERAADRSSLIDEVQTVPTANALSVLDELNSEESDFSPAVLAARRKMKVGYFDLHPDRRPGAVRPSFEEEDPRALLHADSEDDADDEGVAEHDSSVPSSNGLRDSMGDYVPPTPQSAAPLRQIEIPEWTGDIHRPEEDKHALTTSSPGAGASGSTKRKTTTSKTAALIEMYRQREQGAAPQPSRLPVPSGTPSKDSALASLAASSPLVSPENVLQGSRADIGDDPDDGRYKHGVPLYNVLEEEEEG